MKNFNASIAARDFFVLLVVQQLQDYRIQGMEFGPGVGGREVPVDEAIERAVSGFPSEEFGVE